MSSRFLRATSQQVRALWLLALLLLTIVFWPTIQWGISAALRFEPVQTDGVEAVIPRRWVAAKDGSAIQAWTLCPTIFSSPPRSSVVIQVEKNFIGQGDAWVSRMKLTLGKRQSTDPMTRTVISREGRIVCLDTAAEATRGVVDASCLGPDSGIVASFEGAPTELQDFYFMVKSFKAHKGGRQTD
jgi:hypothetical protein